MRTMIAVAFLAVVSAGAAGAQELCAAIAGARIVAEDGTYLGKVASEFDGESTLNEFGRYGGKFSRTSIWNEFSTYGGEFSTQSPFNPYSRTPPMLIKGGEVIAYLTVNRSIQGAVNPYALKSCDF